MRGLDIYENKCYENGRGVAGDTGGRGCGIWVDAASATVDYPIKAHHNVCYDNKGNGLFLELCDYVYAYNNLVYGNATNTGGDDEYCPASIAMKAWSNTSLTNCLVYNNTVYGGRTGLLAVTYDEGTCQFNDCQIKNNIIVGWTEHGLVAIAGGANTDYGSGNVYDYNCLGPESNDFIRWNSTYYDTYNASISMAWPQLHRGCAEGPQVRHSHSQQCARRY